MPNLNVESAALQSFLDMNQGIINRLANNSASCKTWCITIVSAIAVIIAGLDAFKPDHIWISTIPLVLFLMLDSYYLALERHFRDIHKVFVEKVHSGNAKNEDLYVFSKLKGWELLVATIKAIRSFSILPFYGLLIAIVITVYFVVF